MLFRDSSKMLNDSHYDSVIYSKKLLYRYILQLLFLPQRRVLYGKLL